MPPLLFVWLKWQCHKIIVEFSFILWIQPTWASDKLAKMLLLKDLFLQRYSRNKWLRTDWHCTELDSAPTNKVQSQTLLWLTLRGVIQLNKWLCTDWHCTELDSALTNKVRSQTLHWLTLRGVMQLNFRNPKLTNTVRSRTLHRLTLCGVRAPHWLTLRCVRLCAD